MEPFHVPHVPCLTPPKSILTSPNGRSKTRSFSAGCSHPSLIQSSLVLLDCPLHEKFGLPLKSVLHPRPVLIICTSAENFRPCQLFDALVASGNPITDNDLQQAILSGLDQSYDAIVTSLTTLVTVDMDEFFAHLLTYDMRLELQMASLQQPHANVATTNRASNSRSQTFDCSATRSSNRGRNQPHPRSNNTQQPHLQGPTMLET
ncbi:hypothetical protein BVC80_8531g5 [Macleaya cordata]|uniref:Uncharacterized protein n=1 Tax=Macleaya cordata TaxID=56857 RepID=A0A200PMF2_MACCD|nr:hypothetical protein BVC80_8531g5 [Macleaya cordata]